MEKERAKEKALILRSTVTSAGSGDTMKRTAGVEKVESQRILIAAPEDIHQKISLCLRFVGGVKITF